MTGPLLIGGLILFFLGVLRLGSQIEAPENESDDIFRQSAEKPLFPFGRQRTEPVDAERARTPRPF